MCKQEAVKETEENVMEAEGKMVAKGGEARGGASLEPWKAGAAGKGFTEK